MSLRSEAEDLTDEDVHDVLAGPSGVHAAIELINDHPEPCVVCEPDLLDGDDFVHNIDLGLGRPAVVWALVMGGTP